MTLHRPGPVVVGADGSECSLTAVAWAAGAARRHGRDLRIVHAFIWPMVRGAPLGPAPGAPEGAGLRGRAEALLAAATLAAAEAEPEVAVTADLVTGAAGAVLLDAGRTAGLLVVGSRGLGGFGGLLLGSVGAQVAAYAHGPVVVVRPGAAGTGPVVVGVDGSPAAQSAVAFAFAEAAARGTHVVAVHGAAGEPDDYDRHLLAEALGNAAGRHPDVPHDMRHVDGRPAKALIEASARACLVVVGARGRGGFKELLLGSVSQAVIHHARSPVAVVREG